MRTNLNVPFAEKDDAKRLGARWDAARKTWYVENKADLSPFAKWLPSQSVTSGSAEPSPQQRVAGKAQTNAVTIVGSDYVERPRLCSCLPWEVCDKCRP